LTSRRRKEVLRAEGELAKRCAAGEVAAWEELYAKCHDPLLRSIKIMLGRQCGDATLVDEIAARVWYGLVADDGALLAKYNPKRGAKLITFMRVLARDAISRHFREEIRRRQREAQALRERPQHDGSSLDQSLASLKEFMATLSAHEHYFCREYLFASPGQEQPPGQSLPRTTIWQLSRRIYLKLVKFLERNS
jgi:hypothetical protein